MKPFLFALLASVIGSQAIAAPVFLRCQPNDGGAPIPVMFDQASQSVRLRGKAAKRVDISKGEIEFVAEDRSGRPALIRIDRRTGHMRAKAIGGEESLDFTCHKE